MAAPFLTSLPHWLGRRWISVVLVLLGLYTIFGFVGVPLLGGYLARDQVDRLGGRLEIGSISVNPFGLSLVIRDLDLHDGNGQPLLTLAQFSADVAVWQSLRQRALVMQSLALRAPTVEVNRAADGALNWMSLTPPAATQAPAAKAAPSNDLFPFVLNALEISDARINVTDARTPKPLTLTLAPFDVSLDQLSSARNQRGGFRLDGVLRAQQQALATRIRARGQVMLQPLGVVGTVDVSNLQFKPLAAALNPLLPLQLDDGSLGIRAHYALHSTPLMNVDVALRSAELKQLSLTPAQFTEAITLGQLSVSSQAHIALEPALTISAALPALALRALKLPLPDLPQPLTLQKLDTRARLTLDTAPQTRIRAQIEALDLARLALLPPGLTAPLSIATLGAKGAEITFVPTDPPSAQASLQQLDLGTLAITPKDAAPITLAALKIEKPTLSLDQQSVKIRRITLKKPQLSVQRDQHGDLDVLRLLATPGDPADKQTAPQPSSEPPPESTPAWQVAVATLAIEDGRLALTDHSVTPSAQFTLSPLALTVRDFSTAQNPPPLQLQADLHINDRARLKAQGQVRVEPLDATLTLDLQQLALPVFQPYLNALTGIQLADGRLRTAGTLTVRAHGDQATPVAAFTGSAGISGLDVQAQRARAPLLSWQDLAISGIDFNSDPLRVKLAHIQIDAPSATVKIQPDRSINVINALAAPDAAAVADAAAVEIDAPANASADADAAPLALRIDRIDVEKGRLQFADASIEPNFSASINTLAGHISHLSLDQPQPAAIELAGQVDEHAPVAIQGSLVPSEVGLNTDISMHFKNIDLIRFNPYSGRFVGYNITKGKLSTELRYRIENKKLLAEHHVTLNQLTFGEATGSRDAPPLPLKLAVSLLKDRKGNIQLKLPVKGNIDDPSFSVAPLVWKVLRDNIVKAAATPFALLGSLVGGGKELAYVDFDPGSAELSQGERAKLAKLAEALGKRPQLQLDIPVATPTAQDQLILATTTLDAHMTERLGTTPDDASPRARIKALTQLYRQLHDDQRPDISEATRELPRGERADALIAELRQQLLPAFSPSSKELTMLGVNRARAIQSAIVTTAGIDADRTYLTRDAKNGAQTVDQRTRIKLDLQ